VRDHDQRSRSAEHALERAGGAMFQLDVNTRIGLTARFGLSLARA